MKKIFYSTASLICMLVLIASCQNIIEEEIVQNESAVPGRIQIVSEGFESDIPTKTSVSGNDVAWIGDGTEMVAINSNAFNKAVTVVAGKTYIDATPSYPLYGYYGFKNHLSNMTTTNPEISFPTTYESSYKAGRQVIELPMVAYSTTGGDKIKFFHVTAAVKVMIRNISDSPLKLSHVVVSSSTSALSSAPYETAITLNDNKAPTVNPHDLGSGFNGSVTVALGDKPTIPVYSSEADILEVQVPIMPIDDSDLTIEVYAFKEGAVGSAKAVTGVKSGRKNTIYHFTATAAAPALARNKMMTAKIQLQNSTAQEVVDNRTFTINAGGDTVRFSQGNLMYSNGIWSFHTNQYDRCFNYTEKTNVRSEYVETGTFDLFGWGTSGYHNPDDSQNANYYPWSIDHRTIYGDDNPYGFGPSTNMTDKNLTGEIGAKYDWGVYNAISNGGNVAGQWRTLTKEEWLYIANTRQTFPVNGVEHARYVLSFINDDTTPVLGLIIFPDNYVGGTPEGVTWGSINGSMIAGDLSTAGTCSTAGWAALEAAGCVFLPNCGYSEPMYLSNFQGAPQGPGSNSGITLAYWSSTYINKDRAFAYGGSAASGYIFRDGSNFGRCGGLPVRLVKDMKP